MISRDLRVQGRPAQVFHGGTGPGLLLLHGGWGGARLHWEPLWEELARGFTVLAPELPGFGVTPALPKPSFAAYVAWLGELMEAAGLSRATVVGTSFGATLGRALAALEPSRVTHLVMANGGHFADAPRWLKPVLRLPGPRQALSAFLWRHAFSRHNLQRCALAPRWFAQVRAGSWERVRTMRDTWLADHPEETRLHAPTLLLWGDADLLKPLSFGESIQRDIPGARMQPLAGAGHCPSLDRPAEFASAVLRFCGAGAAASLPSE